MRTTAITIELDGNDGPVQVSISKSKDYYGLDLEWSHPKHGNGTATTGKLQDLRMVDSYEELAPTLEDIIKPLVGEQTKGIRKGQINMGNSDWHQLVMTCSTILG